jgi:hypothetical protein
MLDLMALTGLSQLGKKLNIGHGKNENSKIFVN